MPNKAKSATSSSSAQDGPDRRKLVAGVLIGAIVLIGAYFAWTALSSRSRPQDVAMLCSNPKCAYTRAEALQVGETLPMTCPKCGQRTLMAAFRCPQCGTPNIWNENRNALPPTKCRKCGRENYHD